VLEKCDYKDILGWSYKKKKKELEFGFVLLFLASDFSA
jgi:hypothetical protein